MVERDGVSGYNWDIEKGKTWHFSTCSPHKTTGSIKEPKEATYVQSTGIKNKSSTSPGSISIKSGQIMGTHFCAILVERGRVVLEHFVHTRVRVNISGHKRKHLEALHSQGLDLFSVRSCSYCATV